jgi:membrane protein required for colicin V production
MASIADIAIVLIVLISMVVGIVRGFFREVISLVSLVAAIWAAFRLAPLGADLVGSVAGDWISSEALQAWIGRGLIFIAVLLIGGLVGYLITRLLHAGGLSGTDRFLGMGFGFARGALLTGVLALAGNYLGFAQDGWWTESRLLPYAEQIGAHIQALAPRALEAIDDVGIPGGAEQSPDRSRI